MTKNIEIILSILEKEYKNWDSPVKDFIKNSGENNFQVLISTLLSSRTKDEITSKVTKKLFKLIKTPDDILTNKDKIEELIHPVGFYRTKAKRLIEIAKIIKENYNGIVPSTQEELLSLPGVGIKTANIILYRCFGKRVISVDTHVHRISNRLGFVMTKNPEDTQEELEKILPLEWWGKYNTILVALGQKICKPIKPICQQCPVEKYCPKINIRRK